MQRLKKQKIEEILADQNAAIDADMVCSFVCFVFILRVTVVVKMGRVMNFVILCRITRGRDD